MKRKDKRDRLKNLLRQSGLENPSPDFTSILMKEIMTQEEAVINPALQSLLRRNGIETLPSNFTLEIMRQIKVGDFKSAQPIVSKKAWYISAVAVLLLVLYIGFTGQASASPGNSSPYFGIISNSLISFFTTVSSVPVLYMIVFISLVALVVLDYVLRTTKIFNRLLQNF